MIIKVFRASARRVKRLLNGNLIVYPYVISSVIRAAIKVLCCCWSDIILHLCVLVNRSRLFIVMPEWLTCSKHYRLNLNPSEPDWGLKKFVPLACE